jgi:hypothetical protein
MIVIEAALLPVIERRPVRRLGIPQSERALIGQVPAPLRQKKENGGRARNHFRRESEPLQSPDGTSELERAE